MSIDRDYPPPSLLVGAVLGRCPRCNRGSLFKGFVSLAPRCSNCGLDFDFADSGDGPAVFVCLFAGFIVVGAALWTEIAFEPPFWIHLVIFLPMTLVVCLGLLRPLKALLIALQYRNKAEQGHL